ncbi:MAG: nicotinate-nucleotide adenylyltransferase [Bryobacterales bacterium]|nr:nicotinate-nucleotide adenylyltransferase [Bryobacteraceae bacterium]MDW8355004.1 nicotinate-nucleotide adenylyltransferase [Bryobacterales bacterium]
MRIALFGGTFDPIHNGHLTVADEAMRGFALDRVWFIPAWQPPHKTSATAASYEDRYRMVELACQGRPEFVASRLDEGEAPSYSIRTIEKARAALGPADELYFLIGADAFAEIRTWRRWQDVVAAVEFIVVSRPGHRYDVPPGARVHRLETLALPVSSSEVRAKLASGEEPADWLPAPVLAYIRERGLYGTRRAA